MKNKDKLIIIGAGGHGRVVADVAKTMGMYSQIAFLDDNAKKSVTDYPVLGTIADAENFVNEYDFFVAVGDCAIRKRISEKLAYINANLATLIHPSAIIGSSVVVGRGTVVMPGVIINTGVTIGDGAIINTAASVDHDCIVNDYVHVSVGAHLCGTAFVGRNTWIGAGATVINNISICDDCMIGAGAVVVKDIERSGTYLGVPAVIHD
ncbi:MAG: acetyltransferase [Clostridia bacterium]|nr:acetyltransferase [Clostridia bacterium]